MIDYKIKRIQENADGGIVVVGAFYEGDITVGNELQIPDVDGTLVSVERYRRTQLLEVIEYTITL